EESACEFYRHQPEWSRWDLLMQDGLDMRNATAGRVRRELPDHPRGNQSGDGASTNNDQKSGNCVAMGPGDQRIAQAIGMHKQEPEDRPDASSGRSDDERHAGEAQQAQTFVCGLLMVVFLLHLVDNVRSLGVTIFAELPAHVAKKIAQDLRGVHQSPASPG